MRGMVESSLEHESFHQIFKKALHKKRKNYLMLAQSVGIWPTDENHRNIYFNAVKEELF